MGKRRTSAQEQDISRDWHEPEAPAAAVKFWSTEGGKQMLQRVRDFDAAVDACAADAGVKAVHNVRTGSRRIQAAVETMLREAGPSGRSFKKPARAWLRQMKKVRRAAAPTRDLDVHRKLIRQILESPAANAAAQIELFPVGSFPAEPLPAEPLRSQLHILEEGLKQRRRAAARVLKDQIGKRRDKLRERQADFFLAVESRLDLGLQVSRAEEILALEEFVRATDAMSALGPDNLHEFRKRIKRARYIAESGGEEQSAQIVAKALKQIQDVAGDWHDWHCLAEESATAMGEYGPEVTAWLRSRAEDALTMALSTTERIRSRLLSQWAAGGNEPAAEEQRPRRKQPAPESGARPAVKAPAAPDAA